MTNGLNKEYLNLISVYRMKTELLVGSKLPLNNAVMFDLDHPADCSGLIALLALAVHISSFSPNCLHFVKCPESSRKPSNCSVRNQCIDNDS